MSRSLTFIAELNDHAVCLLQHEDYSNGLTFLRKGLREILCIIRNQSQHKNDINTASEISISLVTISESTRGDSDNCFSLLNRGLTFTSTGTSPNSGNTHTKVTSVLLYNSGLACHLQGLKSGSSAHLKKAVQFYEMALSAIDSLGTGRDDFSALALLALANNKGHIKSCFFETEETRSCLELLSGTFSSISHPSAIMGESEYLVFFMSLLYGQQKTPHPFSPAA
ncbi:predicted protein [Phaeodactylum tricornutum CCAP 1055/1]|jgi:hypothetical protein|uniref:Uncharacterized protein n=2 Tax=Phaeodactylum tricornutum TaxID=2850 RepID=B7FYX1_PHATC|nr:predicted protein [Phaeodactylum tricornutum CCAP 1055/1]EEC48433.1 predicted protein [Phaeodactylum tricornutum CCAP 1055/1]|eukprot:XP_002180242.1 predicted protein [Phaeodactylum tricornutum CCAP 1055/1]